MFDGLENLGDFTHADLEAQEIPLKARKPKDYVHLDQANSRIRAARILRSVNSTELSDGKGAPVTARFGPDGVTIIDPPRSHEPFRRIYDPPI
jgi:hypothetical protein